MADARHCLEVFFVLACERERSGVLSAIYTHRGAGCACVLGCISCSYQIGSRKGSIFTFSKKSLSLVLYASRTVCHYPYTKAVEQKCHQATSCCVLRLCRSLRTRAKQCVGILSTQEQTRPEYPLPTNFCCSNTPPNPPTCNQ